MRNISGSHRTCQQNHLAAMLCLAFMSVVLSAASADTSETFLKINQYHVFYTDPIIPHVKNGSFLVGLKGIASLLDASLAENTHTGSATFSRDGHTLKFTAGSRIVQVDAKPGVMPIAAIQVKPSGHLAVPLSVLVQALHLHGQMDKKYHTFVISGPNLIKTTDVGDFPNMVRRYENPDAEIGRVLVCPYSTRFVNSLGKYPEATGQYLEVTAKNVSGHEMEYGVYINLMPVGENPQDNCYYGLPFPADQYQSPPPLSPGGLQKTKVFMGLYPQPETHYVIGWLVP